MDEIKDRELMLKLEGDEQLSFLVRQDQLYQE
jgi:hypothetical protein